jgi:hypothetical protein
MKIYIIFTLTIFHRLSKPRSLLPPHTRILSSAILNIFCKIKLYYVLQLVHRHMIRGGIGLPNVSPGATLPYPSMPCPSMPPCPTLPCPVGEQPLKRTSFTPSDNLGRMPLNFVFFTLPVILMPLLPH